MSDTGGGGGGQDLGGQLTRKLGPLPVWGWGLAAAGGIAVASYLRNRGMTASDASTSVDNTGLDPAAAGDTPDGLNGAAVSDPSVYGANIANPANPAGPGLPGAAPVTTNNQWRQLAVRAAMAAGATGLQAETAVGKYLSGQRLTPTEQGYINTAFSQLGDPPSPPPLTPGQPKKKAKKHPGKKPGHKTHDPKHHHPAQHPGQQHHGHQDGLPKTHQQHGTRGAHGPNRRDNGSF